MFLLVDSITSDPCATGTIMFSATNYLMCLLSTTFIKWLLWFTNDRNPLWQDFLLLPNYSSDNSHSSAGNQEKISYAINIYS